ncbi:MAG: SDR family NAD(P)-dependent oxidoreductase [Blastocatellia bacterium]|nr:SDR family NAD(P)-dependent oxidoreductase [Blastocatellia bacterium]
MPTQTVVITGANVGLGFACARAVLNEHREWHVVLACRSRERGETAARQLCKETGNSQVSVAELDLASLASVRDFAGHFVQAGSPPLHSIVCNAGLQFSQGRTVTADGFESTFGVNHLGHFLLVHLLLRQLAGSGRVVMVSSGTHDPAQRTGLPAPRWVNPEFLAFPEHDPQPLQEPAGTAGRRAYSTSKLCNLLFTYELTRRLEAAGRSVGTAQPITINGFNPGLMPGTNLARDYGPVQQFAWNYLLPVLALVLPNARTVTASGKALAGLACASEFEAVTGKYFDGRKETASSAESYDRNKALELWEASCRLTRLTPAETIVPLEQRLPVAAPLHNR